MKIRFANKENRKELVKEIESIMQRKAKYLGMPSCAYQVGSITIEKDGNIEVPEHTEVEQGACPGCPPRD